MVDLQTARRRLVSRCAVAGRATIRIFLASALAWCVGTMFAPIQDRAAKGQGFTHVEGDLVTVATPRLGRLTNRMRRSGACEPWDFGLTALIAALMRRKGARK